MRWTFITACFTFLVAIFFVLLQCLSFAISGSWKFSDTAFLSIIRLDELSVGISVYWYMFQELFPAFATFFLAVLQAIIVLYPVPLVLIFTSRMREKPAAYVCASVVAYGIFVFARMYSTATDYAVMLTMFCVLWHCNFSACVILQRNQHEEQAKRQSVVCISNSVNMSSTKKVALSLMGALFFLALVPVTENIWLIRNTGNANHTFFVDVFYHVMCTFALYYFTEALCF